MHVVQSVDALHLSLSIFLHLSPSFSFSSVNVFVFVIQLFIKRTHIKWYYKVHYHFPLIFFFFRLVWIETFLGLLRHIWHTVNIDRYHSINVDWIKLKHNKLDIGAQSPMNMHIIIIISHRNEFIWRGTESKEKQKTKQAH